MLKFALTLSALGRDEAGRRAVLSYLAEFGIEQTGGGFATLSFAATEAGFAAAFHCAPPPSERDAMTVGASAPPDAPDVPVPTRLSALVNQISVAPPARHFSGKP